MVSATGVFAMIKEAWAKKQRKADLKFLWPSLQDLAESRGLRHERAVDAFLNHAHQDEAWAGLSDEQIREILSETKKPASHDG